MKITGRKLIQRGWKQGQAIGVAIKVIRRAVKDGMDQEDAIDLADQVAAHPDQYIDDPVWNPLAECFQEEKQRAADSIRDTPVEYAVCGREDIESEALAQMDAACRLPVAHRGFLAPDAHVGYGLPIGGVLATRDAVIPWAVGVDIGCRMKLSITELPANRLEGLRGRLVNAIEEETSFGMGADFQPGNRREHPVMEDPAWRNLPGKFRQLHQGAWKQLGSSGGGNHFVEWGTLKLDDPTLGVAPGEYLALLSHSGSRGFGSKIAEHYSKLAAKICSSLPRQFSRLAWLAMSSAEGQEYWEAMNLAGRYAAANHDCIHRHVLKAAGIGAILQVDNHHNFAWREKHDGETYIVHRKGATPAGRGILGFIPGSMADPGYLVRGLGDEASLHSASHGAGRAMSRMAAKKSFTNSQVRKLLAERGVELLSGGLDECPMAYKDIRRIMANQSHLVETLGEFHPRIVKMAPEEGRPRRRR
ncbi:MAG: RtcB family protein [Candidatus Sumerlaeia bacterium]|nr:RtcB family protein [Candidatus Sumerlaeia bacterium]